MSFLAYVVYWVVIPIIAIWMARLLIRSATTRLSHRLVVAVCVVAFFLLFWILAGGDRWWVDRQVRELCAIDGGIKVYETVKLPAEKFNQWGQPNFYRPTQHENALGSEYIFKVERKYLREGEPSLRRYHVSVLRRSDQKLLGESIGYDRSGGDLPGPWQGSSFSCPEIVGEVPLLTKIFAQTNKE